METLKQKITGFRFIVFICAVVLVGGFVVFCNINEKLIPLQGIIVAVVSLAGLLITGKTYTDIKGKKQ